MTFTETVHVGKTPEQAVADRHAGLAIAFVVFVAILAAVLVTMRRLHSRVAQEQAERVLRESIDRLDGDA